MDRITFENILNKASKLLGFDKKDYLFEYVECENLYVSLNGGNVTVGGTCIADFYRGFMLFHNELKNGKAEFSISQKRHFDTLGFSIDLSRNGVINVDKIKEIIDYIALLGFNVLKLYMEDVFELPGYPHFGYRRGRYTHDELKEIDDYAYSMGIEVIPGIQTLGHLSQYLRYNEASPLRENANVLLCGSDATYDFIEAIIKTMRKCFRTKRLGVNCDEASGVGIKKIMKEKQYINVYDELIIPHLEKILEISNKYDFRPLVDGDLFYGHLGEGYYDFDFSMDEDKKTKVPDLDIIYWDYYHLEYQDYETLLKGHKTIGDNIVFLGGVWIWAGQLPQVDFTIKTMTPAMQVCLDYEIKDVWAATFGDDGSETNIAFALPSLLVFSEHCFRGREYKEEYLYEIANNLLKLDMKSFIVLSDYHYPWVNEIEKAEYIWPNYMGKKVFYTDLFYNMTETSRLEDVLAKHVNALEVIESAGKDTPWEKYFDYARLVFSITIKKLKILIEIRKAYKERNIKTLTSFVEISIPLIIEDFKSLSDIHEKMWLNMYKPFGWEELCGRYGWVIARLKYVQRILRNFIKGEIDSIPELEFEFLETRNGCFEIGGCTNFSVLKSACK